MALRRLGPLVVFAAALFPLAAGASNTTSSTRPGAETTTTLPTTSTAASTTTTTLAPTTTTLAPIVLAKDPAVTVAVSHLPSSLNPWTIAGSDPVASMIMSQVLPQASVVDERSNSTVCGTSAPSCPEALFTTAEPVSLNPQKVVYTLSPEARWSDGVPVSINDFLYLWQHVRELASRLPSIDPVAGYLDIASITASPSAPSVITVEFKKPYGDWPALFTNLLPEHIAAKVGFDKTYELANAAGSVSAGPYRISKVIVGHDLVLTRNPAFWGQPSPVKTIIVRVMPSEPAVLQALSRGSLDVAALPPGPAVDRVVRASTHLVEQGATAPVLWQLAFNLADPTIAHLDVREAIAMAVDREEIVENTVGLENGYSATSGNRLLMIGSPGSVGNDSAFQAVNLTEADQLLETAGFAVNANGVVSTGAGHPLSITLTVPSGSTTITGVAEEIQAQLLQLGVTVDLKSVPLATMLGSLLPSGAYQFALVPYALSPYPSTTATLYTDPVDPATLAPHPALSAAAGRAAGAAIITGSETRDIVGYSDPLVASLFAQAAQQLNLTSEISDFNAIDADMWKELPTLPLFQAPIVLVYRAGLLNLGEAPTSEGFLWNAEEWAVEANPPPTSTTTTSTIP